MFRRAISCLVFLVLLTNGLAFFFPGGSNGKPNPINPNFTYVEVNKVDKKALNIPYPGEFYTGYITVNQTSGSKIFYQLYSAGGNKRASTVNDTAPLIMQLPGGPGCPGGGSFYEHGPFRVDNVDDQFSPTLNDVTWNDDYHLLYLDNPAGVGYSVVGSDFPAYALENGLHLVAFLKRFYELFPNLKKQNFYAIGESYGGHMVLGMATQIIANPQLGIKLTGLGFQSGWYDPYWQINTWAKNLYAAGILDGKGSAKMSELISKFQQTVKAGDWAKAFTFVAPIEGMIPKGYSASDVRNNDTEWDGTTLIWLNMPDTKKYLAADPKTTWGCIGLKDHYALDFVQSYAPNITYMLNNHNISFIFYQGQDDFLVPATGTQSSILHFGWTNLAKFAASPNNVWRDPQGYVIGQYKHYDKLTYATVNKAGHNAAHDQPWSVKNLIQRWINNKWN